jgi:hypothetical protein
MRYDGILLQWHTGLSVWYITSMHETLDLHSTSALCCRSTTVLQPLHSAACKLQSVTVTTKLPFNCNYYTIATALHACTRHSMKQTLPVTASIQFSNFKSLCITFLWCMKATALSMSVSIAIIAGSLAQRPGVAVVDDVVVSCSSSG